MSKIIVGMSGGVDSSVTAWKLLEQGHKVSGLFMKNWDEDDGTKYCTALQDLEDAQQVCDRLGIELATVNFAAEYWDEVFSHFLAEYRAGRTPNPDILCNKHIKFKAFLDYALDLGAEYIATGHYARVRRRFGRFELLRGVDGNKDQSYFLYAIGQEALSRTLFPLGDLEKAEVRAIAKRCGFPNHSKKDSTGICFIGERKFRDFLRRYLPARPGLIETPDGEVIGEHLGLMYYTLGQRQGLGIGGRAGANQEPWYLIGKDLQRNVLIVGQGHDHPMLFHNELEVGQLEWLSGVEPSLPLACTAKIRYRQKDQPCKVLYDEDNRCRIVFDQPQRAITPGQSIVFYDGEVCLGGGVIESVVCKEKQALSTLEA
ncbi:MAG: tRNA 2-thiouridine(34) synthase MnmA [Methylothermaceae bacteria B42]|nr:MAG: tRNA 2-thiouridine(34) synthase MnmA [Methylothermaceae bacteria B42]HHJ38754.1 tRNA 2-thiouridine(34) synthase MnmA [Methylothermaceae bacterium]